jgi:hypothetical protein
MTGILLKRFGAPQQFVELPAHLNDLVAHVQRHLHAFEIDPEFPHQVLRDSDPIYLVA